MYISDRALLLSVRSMAALLALGSLGLVALVVGQRYVQPSVSVVDRDTQAIENEVRQRPNDPELRVALANVYLAKNRDDEALGQADQALKADPAHVGAAIAYAQAAFSRGETDRAADRLTSVLARNADNPVAGASLELALAHQLLGRIDLDRQQPAQAAVELQASLEIDRTNADSLYLLGRALAQQGETDQAVAAYQAALRFVPDFGDVYRELAGVYDQTGQPERARVARAMLSYSTGAYAEAATALTLSAAALPDSPDVFIGLAMAEEHLGRVGEARTHYQQALALDSDSMAARQGVGRLDGRS
jgi:tetratricopeptide (TPR) repeat protein